MILHYPFNIFFSTFPNFIIFWNHCFDKIFKFARRKVVRHKPNSNLLLSIYSLENRALIHGLSWSISNIRF